MGRALSSGKGLGWLTAFAASKDESIASRVKDFKSGQIINIQMDKIEHQRKTHYEHTLPTAKSPDSWV